MKVIRNMLIIILFFFSFKVNALENCVLTDEYQKYMELSDEEKELYLEPIRCKTFSDEEKKDAKNPFDAILRGAYPEKYNYNTSALNYITSPKDQYDLGTCWAFAAISVVESNALKNNVGNYDLSEEHLLYSVLASGYSDTAGKKGKYNVNSFDGGKITYASSYFFNGYGQLYENEWPYVNAENQITSSQYKTGRQMLSVDNYEIFNLDELGPCSSSNIENIKNRIYNYGAVQASMYMDTSLFKDSAKNYYLSTTNNGILPNHGVTIVGWDDTIASSKFNGATNPGAWIIKNSWGTTWSDDGYFYISYDDNFICKNNVSYSGVANKKYDYTYKAADMVGLPDFAFGNTFHLSAKFTKKSLIREQLKRVSFPTGTNSSYKVYLSRSNTLESTNDWELLDSGSSNNYGIKSVDLSNKVLNDDYTIIVKYSVDTGKTSTVFSMCNGRTETSKMEISKGVNFYSTSEYNWYDMGSMKIGGNTVGCEPNIFAYTSEVSSDVAISSISVGDIITANLYMKNANTNNISYSITDVYGSNVTSLFTVTPNYSGKTISIKSDGRTSGTYYLNVTYDGNTSTKKFTLVESVTSLNTNFIKISSPNIFVTIGNNYSLDYSKLTSKISVKNSTYSVLNPSGNVVSSTSIVGTNYKFKTNNNLYKIVVKGDVNGDGKITALDYIEVRKHIMGTKITDNGKWLASDMDNNSSITALDYIAIRKIMMR